MPDHELAAVGLLTVLTVGSELADGGLTHHRGDEGPRLSHQSDLGSSSSSHLTY